MRVNKWFLISLCAGIALGFLLILSVKKVGGEYVSPISVISEEPTPTPKSNPEFQPEYYSGKVSYYDRTYCEKFNPSCLTASGEVFDDTAFTCACGSNIKLGSFLKISYQGSSVIVKCNDRGGFEAKGRIADLSKASFEALASLSKGVIRVKMEVLK